MEFAIGVYGRRPKKKVAENGDGGRMRDWLEWLRVVPWGIHDHLVYLKRTYPEIPPIYITENGVSDKNNCNLMPLQACHDTTRVRYHQDHLANVLKAIRKDKVNVRGYLVWSWCDNFEWTEGYTIRFGIIYIDFKNNLTRYPKDSTVWFAKFLKSKKKKSPFPPHSWIWFMSNKRQLEDNGENETQKWLKVAKA
ncbi:hypothetical protein BUALT_Bualt07G0055400 [Buddleja alternifolia]|uniref:beta-glucosidase n=1 Tax=Buddleja alternifolia TaxID=168488 RepID=A0AAV6X9M8_9LAMI|nr:hypothetical protein BUALT_Bualt07G0055400 [Buddleja alternifolia]